MIAAFLQAFSAFYFAFLSIFLAILLPFFYSLGSLGFWGFGLKGQAFITVGVMREIAATVMLWSVFCEQDLAFKPLIGKVISVEKYQRSQTAMELNDQPDYLARLFSQTRQSN